LSVNELIVASSKSENAPKNCPSRLLTKYGEVQHGYDLEKSVRGVEEKGDATVAVS
jgi:hypothetical protein